MKNHEIDQYVLIIGAGSEISKALSNRLLSEQNTGQILISRQPLCSTTSDTDDSRISHLQITDYQQASIIQAVGHIKQYATMPITRVFICNGLLHGKNIQPEKKMEDIDPLAFQALITANTLTPMLWLQSITPLLTSSTACKVVVFNARVGSITDNNLGGWYSYRASKAALNMLLKTATIELARRAKNIKLISFHPGTTDTPLSKPFQKNVAPDKLFSGEFVAKQLLTVVNNCPHDHQLSYLDWQGKTIPW